MELYMYFNISKLRFICMVRGRNSCHALLKLGQIQF